MVCCQLAVYNFVDIDHREGQLQLMKSVIKIGQIAR